MLRFSLQPIQCTIVILDCSVGKGAPWEMVLVANPAQGAHAHCEHLQHGHKVWHRAGHWWHFFSASDLELIQRSPHMFQHSRQRLKGWGIHSPVVVWNSLKTCVMVGWKITGIVWGRGFYSASCAKFFRFLAEDLVGMEASWRGGMASKIDYFPTQFTGFFNHSKDGRCHHFWKIVQIWKPMKVNTLGMASWGQDGQTLQIMVHLRDSSFDDAL